MALRNFIDDSKLKYSRETADDKWLTIDEISLGCMQRIADATEAMSENYVYLLNHVESLRAENKRLQDRVVQRNNTIRGMKGEITKLRMKKAIDTL